MCLSLEYRDIILGFLTGEMDLLNEIIILGKAYLWTCRCKETKPSFNHFERILLDKYQTEKYISFKSNSINLFKEKWSVAYKQRYKLCKKHQIAGYSRVQTIHTMRLL